MAVQMMGWRRDTVMVEVTALQVMGVVEVEGQSTY